MDFTDVGANAVKYALNAFKGRQITILYVKSGMVDTKEPLIVRQALLQEDYWKKALAKFVIRELKLEILPVNIDIAIASGTTVFEIHNYCSVGNYDAIVMGTRDKYNYFDKWFGTTSVGVVKGAKVPVYLIPKYASFSGYKKIMIASDEHLSNPSLINKINSWNKEYKAYAKFLHVQNGKDDDFNKEKMAIVSELFVKGDLEFAFEIEVIQDRNITHSLLASAYNMKADALIVIPGDQNYLETILFRSMSKDLILQSDIPLLFINSKT